VQDIQLEKNEVVLKLALGFVSPVSVRGRPLLQNGTVVFEPQQVVAAPAGVTPTQVFAFTRFSYPVSGLLFGAQASGLQVRKDHVMLSGTIQNIPLGPPSG
jgi:hypothetical protein